MSKAMLTMGLEPSPALGTADEEEAVEPLEVLEPESELEDPEELEVLDEPVELVELAELMARALNASKVLFPLVGLYTLLASLRLEGG